MFEGSSRNNLAFAVSNSSSSIEVYKLWIEKRIRLNERKEEGYYYIKHV
jgi:hypothetical protein